MSLFAACEYLSCAKACLAVVGRPRSHPAPKPAASPSKLFSRSFTSRPRCLANTAARPLVHPQRQRGVLGYPGNTIDGARGIAVRKVKHPKYSPQITKPATQWESTLEGPRFQVVRWSTSKRKNPDKYFASLNSLNELPPPRMNKPPICAPSEESGGVPDASAEYLRQAAVPSTRLDTAQPLLVVVDLNGTLLHRPDGWRNPKKFVRRPYAALFLSYFVKTFWVVFWSSARPENVTHLCRSLITAEAMQKVVSIWDRSKFGLTKEDYYKRVQCYKRLTSLWADPEVARSHPTYSEGGRWSQANTVLIDDSPEKARTEPFNVISVPEFLGKDDVYEAILPRVHDYVNELCFESDVSAYMKAIPFVVRTDIEAVETPSERFDSFYHAKQKKRDRNKERNSHAYTQDRVGEKSIE